MQLHDAPVLVTGGGSGLGLATALRLRRAGARVAVLDRDAEALAKTAGDAGLLALPCDVTDEDAVKAALAAARDAHGQARVLVHCAGVGGARRVLGRDGPMPLEDFTRTVGVNLVGSFNMLRLAAEAMGTHEPLDDGERGVIILTASIAAFEGQIGQAAYAASKGGIVAMTLPAARELARFGIRVLCIAPGLFATPLMDALPEDVQASLGASVPYPNRLGQPDEFAALVEHCIGNRALNGETIRLDGALRLPFR